jgi:L,D-peptidoglycan transpeptidase YkuD (ErfK/YbiS/YcfS/YnhG family)
MPPRKLTRLLVRAEVGQRSRGSLLAGPASVPCALGRAGLVVSKREGDGGTPVARLPLRRFWLRRDRLARPRTALPCRAITPRDAWCDDARDRRYNRPILRPEGEAEERLWRQDPLYDLVVELGWNDRPVRRGHGSAIFWHLARPGFTPTAGCVAVTRADLLRLLPRLSRRTVLVAGPVKPRRQGPKPWRQGP